MTHQCRVAVVRLIKLTTCVLLCASCKVGSTQTIEEILGKCRASLASISSYEYSAISTSNRGENRKFFFARDGEAFRYDQKTDSANQKRLILAVGLHPNKFNWYWHTRDFRVGFDGTYYYEDNERNNAERIGTSPIAKAEVFEPFYQCFGWLHAANSRLTILEKSRWDDFAKFCEGFVSKQQVEGLSCSVVTSRRIFEGWRYEVAFGEEVGYLPVRVRRLVGEEGRIVAEWIFTDFKHVKEGEAIYHFPTQFISKLVMSGEPISCVTRIKPGTLYVNQSIDYELIRLKYDSAGFYLMDADGIRQEWFSDAETDNKDK